MGLFSSNVKSKVSAIVAAAGDGLRMNIQKSKQVVEICGKPVIAHSLLALQSSDYIGEIIIVTRECDILLISDIVKAFDVSKVTHIVKGGKTRTESVKNGLDIAKYDYVAIHDGARPCVRPEHIDKTIEDAIKTGAAALGCPVIDTLKRVDEQNIITQTVDRSALWQIQTPQVFKKDLILKAYENQDTTGATDDCMLVESAGAKVTMTEGERSNIKITYPSDIALAEAILKGSEDE